MSPGGSSAAEARIRPEAGSDAGFVLAYDERDGGQFLAFDVEDPSVSSAALKLRRLYLNRQRCRKIDEVGLFFQHYVTCFVETKVPVELNAPLWIVRSRHNLVLII
ncbi:hypothetical protein SAMN05444920_103875 [Nonomuraea solani]|uniref:Uncharacterized protein n=1 Tax=Nonomuraea solani TaxID=1144553 RepID=A0A1H6C3E7_9ACTN|nr:hypothetical protein SAMN05444920_103875 [Nonomuraea solani]